MRAALLATALLAAPNPGAAQTLEIEGGVGYVFGGGAENPGPSLPAFNVGVAVWPWETWGVAVRLLEAPGEDLYQRPGTGNGDRTFLGQADLHYWLIGARRRWMLSPRSRFELGIGTTIDARFSAVVEFRDPSLGRQTYPDSFFSNAVVEGLFTHAIGRRIAVKAGLTYDSNFETTNIQPIALAVLRY